MRVLAFGLVLAAAVGACARQPDPSAAPAAAEPAAPLDLAEFPAPTFLENLTLASDGQIHFTNYIAKTIEARAADGAGGAVIRLPHHPVSLLPHEGGFLVAAHATPFTAGPAFIGSGRILTLAADGAVVTDIAVPDAGMLNGMERLADGSVLIADSVKGQILRFTPETGAIEPWFSAAQLGPSGDGEPFRPGANGLKRQGDMLYVSSSAARTIFSLALQNGQPKGALTPVAKLPGVDDFALAEEGGFLAATHLDSLIWVRPDGAQETLIQDARLDGATAVILVGEGADRRAVALGTGGFSEGRGAPAFVLSVPAPAP